jgi:CRISPR system Cascade subunit CasB
MRNESAHDAEATQPDQSLNTTVHKIASYLSREEFAGGVSTGDLAELRRIKPDEPYTPALWRILLNYVPNDDQLSAERERRWAILLMAMATCAGLHDPSTDFGAALADAGWSELRFVRLLEARGDNLDKQLRRVAQYLASKDQQANWADAAWLLFVQQGDHASTTRQRIARSYYRRRYANENEAAE